MRKKLVLILSTFIFGALIFALVLKLIGAKNLIISFKDFSLFPFIAFIMVSFLMMAVAAYRWKIIIEAHDSRVDFWSLFFYRISGFALSYITPGALVGGEALKAYFLKRHKIAFSKGLSSVIIDGFFDISVVALLTSLGFVVVVSLVEISKYYKAMILLAVTLWMITLSFFLYGTLTRKGFFRHIFRFFGLYRFNVMRSFEKIIYETEENMSHFFIRHKKVFRRCTVLSFIVWILMFADYKIATVVFGYDTSLASVFLIICTVGFAYLMPVPAGLGILEAGQASVYTFIGLKAAQGIAFSLVVRMRDIMWTLIGVAFTYLHGINMAKQITKPSKK